MPLAFMNGRNALFALAIVACASCAPPVAIDEQNTARTATDFANGNIDLANSLATLAGYDSYRSKMHILYVNQDWQSLSKLVIEVNFDNDLDWFYLGRSAEGLGLKDAARRYYAMALSSIHKCDGSITGYECDGLYFPRDILARVNAMSASQ